jgi:hypothetical protein
MNWGKGITIGMIAFMSFIVFLVTKMIGQKVDLVQEGYYKSDLEYEKQQAKEANYLALKEKVSIAQVGNQLEIIFPSQELSRISSGTVLLFRPSEKKDDKLFPLTLNSEGKQLVSTSNLSTGLWKVKLDWKEGDVPFYTEKELMLQ